MSEFGLGRARPFGRVSEAFRYVPGIGHRQEFATFRGSSAHLLETPNIVLIGILIDVFALSVARLVNLHSSSTAGTTKT